MKLLVRPYPKFEESLLGYLKRVAFQNSYASWRWIAAWLRGLGLRGIIRQSVRGNPATIKVLSDALGIAEGRLIIMTYPYRLPAKKFCIVDGFGDLYNLLGECFFNPNQAPICVKCLKRKGYIQRSWDCLLKNYCVEHKTPLLANCPQCDQVVSNFRHRLFHCKCGYDFREAVNFSNASPYNTDHQRVGIELSRLVESFMHGTGSEREAARIKVMRIKKVIQLVNFFLLEQNVGRRCTSSLKVFFQGINRVTIIKLTPQLRWVLGSKEEFIQFLFQLIRPATACELRWLIDKCEVFFRGEEVELYYFVLQLEYWRRELGLLPISHRLPLRVQPKSIAKHDPRILSRALCKLLGEKQLIKRDSVY